MHKDKKDKEYKTMNDFIKSLVLYSHDDYLLRHMLVKMIRKNFNARLVIFIQWDIFQADERIGFIEYSQESLPIERMRSCLTASSSLIRSFTKPTLTILPVNKCCEFFFTKETYIIPFFQDDLLLGDLLIFGLESETQWYKVNKWVDQVIPYISMILFNSMNYQQIESVIQVRTDKFIDKNQELLQEKQALKLRLSHVAHEMKAPINGIMGYFDIIRDNQDINEIKQYLKIMEEAGRSLEHQVKQILETPSESDRQMITKMHVFNLYECIDHVIMLYIYQALRKNIQLEVSYSPTESILVYGDRENLKEILNNLLDNALKYTEEGSIYVTIKTSKHTHKGKVRIDGVIADTGIGISEDYLPQIFNVFSQADSEGAEGLGLGLSIVKRLVKSMDGSMDVTSKLGEGSQFNFSIYLKKAENNTIEESRNIMSINGFNHHYMKEEQGKVSILLVEDNELNRDLIKEILRKRGVLCQIAENGREALEQIKKNHYPIILMDCVMPIMDGYMATRLIREYYYTEKSESEQPYIIALTANQYEEDVKRCYDVGMNDFIAKPIQIQCLLEHLNKIIETL